MNRTAIGFAAVMPLALLTGCGAPAPCRVVEPGQPASPLDVAPYRSTGDVYAPGPLAVTTVDVGRCEFGAPRPLRIHRPQDAGAYALILFQHGFMTRNAAYDEMLRHVASHGFVVVAPQMYEPGLAALLGSPTAADEAVAAAEIIAWLGAPSDSPAHAVGRMDLLAMAGHSRGGKVAWAVAAAGVDSLRAIAFVDPVDGAGGPLGNQPRVLEQPLPANLPVLAIGTELGGACAPAGDNHEQFYAAASAPAWHVIALNVGHGDVLDEPDARAAALVCASGSDRAGMRRLTAGLMVALFKAALLDDQTASEAISHSADDAPLAVTVESK